MRILVSWKMYHWKKNCRVPSVEKNPFEAKRITSGEMKYHCSCWVIDLSDGEIQRTEGIVPNWNSARYSQFNPKLKAIIIMSLIKTFLRNSGCWKQSEFIQKAVFLWDCSSVGDLTYSYKVRQLVSSSYITFKTGDVNNFIVLRNLQKKKYSSRCEALVQILT